MKEIVLRHFFEGHATVEELAADVAGAFDRRAVSAGTVFSELHSVPMGGEFAIATHHVLKLVDAALAERLSLEALDAICFCLEASGSFAWDADTSDGARVANALFWLGTPEVNYTLTSAALGKVRHYILTGANTFTPVDLRLPGDRPHLLSVRRLDRDGDV